MSAKNRVFNAAAWQDALVEAVDQNNLEAVRAALAHGADANKPDKNGNHPIIIAVLRRADILQLLIDSGADVNQQRGSDGETALFIASYYGRQKSVRLLLDAGADPDIRDNDDRTAEDVVSGDAEVEILQLLLNGRQRLAVKKAAHEKEKAENRKKALHGAIRLARDLPYKKSPFRKVGR